MIVVPVVVRVVLGVEVVVVAEVVVAVEDTVVVEVIVAVDVSAFVVDAAVVEVSVFVVVTVVVDTAVVVDVSPVVDVLVIVVGVVELMLVVAVDAAVGTIVKGKILQLSITNIFIHEFRPIYLPLLLFNLFIPHPRVTIDWLS